MPPIEAAIYVLDSRLPELMAWQPLSRAGLRVGILFISVAHRTSVMQYHTALLCLDGKGGYDVRRIDNIESAEVS